ncbi:short chain dehydrogenase/reductase family protein [Penicillium canescens]|uniref:Short chain dehydrogenase/reductase family protein n=1 Tax=Penicillium canescens TaxID=5083 RepID=A0AAD6I5A3_PENCN|nr:short chain dehydrogenase/reductase family protein [Penicillium canescens]KAJ6034175.1 short chain dehydrogenase/reductase family protein [Penicillium canescens]KAJ6038911.1 short chain dehydrogenase/reductase family protein [Penicillium canescens]KAJ6066105.1 short chain dehydrogenase/reductase family protein [Penicillium canescens]KAJ6091078.1 short chain dehydrogenase/reductase family protein [Penicillium canescens]KAJ6174753.1 short chain dehydrogenase/reductase family protein [Penicill
MSFNLSTENLFPVDGLVAVVTGAGSGIGSMIVRALATNGASAVYAVDIENYGIEKVAQEAVHHNVHALVCDVTSKTELQTTVDQIAEERGYINLLVNNAGRGAAVPIPKPTPKSSIQEVREYYFNTLRDSDLAAVFGLNTIAVFNTTFAFLELLDAGNKAHTNQPKSQVVTVSNAAAFFRGYTDFIYNSSKAATTHMMMHLATALVPWNIRSNLIDPGWFPSRITARLIEEHEPTAGVVPKSISPAERFGVEKEMARTILYLASKAGGYCNGSVSVVDGGALSVHPRSY